MNFIKRALTSIVRKKSKTIILLVLIFILGNVIAGAISVEQAVKNTEQNIRKQIGGVATIEVDYEKIGKDINFDYSKIKYVTADTIEQIGKSQYIKYYDYIMTTSLQSKNLKRYTNPEDENSETRVKMMAEMPGGQYFNFMGVHYLDVLDFKEGKAKLVEGRTFKDTDNTSGKNVAIISKNLAETNNLGVGSVITLENNIYKYGASESMVARETQEPSKTLKYEFEVIGLFEPEKTVQNNNNGGIDFNYINEEFENRIYTTKATVKVVQNEMIQEQIKVNPETEEAYKTNQNEYYTPIFVLNDPVDLKVFKEEATPLLPEYSIITDSSSSFDAVAAPMKNMEWIASIVLYVALGATLVILSLLITLFLRDRKHEIGIYLSLGEKKKNVICQIILEVMLVAFVAITLSLITGNFLSRGMSEKMLNNQIIAEQENGRNTYVSYGGTLSWLGYGSNISQEELVDSYNVSLGLSTILMFYLVGLGTVLVSTLVPIIYITRLNPKKIMM